jgi:hypothetical protein
LSYDRHNISELARELGLLLHSYISGRVWRVRTRKFSWERQFKTNIEQEQLPNLKAQRRRTRTRYIKKTIGIFSKTVDDLYFHQK